jgi:hypothetical protein
MGYGHILHKIGHVSKSLPGCDGALLFGVTVAHNKWPDVMNTFSEHKATSKVS